MTTSDPLAQELQHHQERAEMMGLLREQENLARLEELRSRQELEEFVASQEHEKKLHSILRQEEMDRLWTHLQARAKEEALQRRLEELRLLRDVQAVQREIADLRGQIAVGRERKAELQREITAGRDTKPFVLPKSATDSVQAKHEMIAKTGLASAEWALASRMEERLESLLAGLEKLAADGSQEAASVTLDVDLALPAAPYKPGAIIVASRGVARLDQFPPNAAHRPRRLPGYESSTRSLCVVFHPDGQVPILLAGHRRGICHLDPGGATVIANYPLSEPTRYAINSTGFAWDGRLMGSHSELGVLAWTAPDRVPEAITEDVRSARLLQFFRGGKIGLFASNDRLYCLDAESNRSHVLYDLQGRVITSLALAGQLAILGDSQGAVTLVDLREPARRMPALLVGEKVYTVGVLDWRDTTWLAAGVKRRTGAYVIMKDLSSPERPELMLNIPERIHTIRAGGEGELVACSERFLSYWDLSTSLQSQVVSLIEVQPVQDFALVRD